MKVRIRREISPFGYLVWRVQVWRPWFPFWLKVCTKHSETEAIWTAEDLHKDYTYEIKKKDSK